MLIKNDEEKIQEAFLSSLVIYSLKTFREYSLTPALEYWDFRIFTGNSPIFYLTLAIIIKNSLLSKKPNTIPFS